MTPTLPFRVIVMARRQAGSTVPMIGMSFSRASRSSATAETVLQAMMIALRSNCRKNATSCRAYLTIVSRPRVP